MDCTGFQRLCDIIYYLETILVALDANDETCGVNDWRMGDGTGCGLVIRWKLYNGSFEY